MQMISSTRIQRWSLGAALLAMLPMLDLVLNAFNQDSVLWRLGVVDKTNLNAVFRALMIAVFVLLLITIIDAFAKSDKVGILGILASILISFASFGFCWDIITSAWGIYDLLIFNFSEVNLYVAIIFAIVTTTFSFFITLRLPENIAAQLGKPLRGAIGIAYKMLYLVSLSLDLYTSFLGNIALLGIPRDISQIPLAVLVILTIGTLFVCLCQYVVIVYFIQYPSASISETHED